MTIVLCGGGSGGHITPLLAVASELRKKDKSVRLIYIGEKGGKFTHIAATSNLFDELHYISAGKLRRYYGESILKQMLDIKTVILNIRDIFRLLVGLLQSYFLIKKIKPNSILLKGGFVCVPVAAAAKLNNVPYVTHDSDALPGLSNRIAARWARYHATAMPAKYYGYPPKSIRVVGVPSDSNYREYSKAEVNILKGKYNIDSDSKVILITGGSNGARRLNTAVIECIPRLLEKYPNLFIMHQIGAGNDDQKVAIEANNEVKKRVKFFDFTSELFHMSAVADVIVTRAGASTMADFSAQSKACIVVPNPLLTGGHQLKNAEVYHDANAAMIVTEPELTDESDRLFLAISELLENEQKRSEFGRNLHILTPPINASRALAELVMEVAK